MLTSTRTLTILGLAAIAVGIPVWVLTGSGAIGVVVVLLGAVVLGLAALGHSQRANDAEARLRNHQADEQRLQDETTAGAENLEERPPPTGG